MHEDLISRQKAKDVIDTALDSIDHVPSWVYDKLLNALNEVPSVKPTHPTPSNTLGALDCVERQKAIEAAIDAADDWDGGCSKERERFIREALEELPSVPRKGKWEDETFKPWGPVFHPYKCDQCGEHSEAPSNFCPNCGCRMEEGDAE